jgi:hypothetical protein
VAHDVATIVEHDVGDAEFVGDGTEEGVISLASNTNVDLILFE